MDAGDAGASLRELLEKVTSAVGVRARIEVTEDEEAVTGALAGDDLGLLIGRHGQTIDAIQYLANVIAWREHGDERKDVVVDAAGYRERRRETLEALADRTAEHVKSSGEPVELEPMSSIERRDHPPAAEGRPRREHAQRGRGALPLRRRRSRGTLQLSRWTLGSKTGCSDCSRRRG